MQQEVDPNVILLKFQKRLSDEITKNIVLEAQLEATSQELDRLNKKHGSVDSNL